MADDRELTIDELAGQADVPVRTVRFYIAEGLLPRPEGRGKAASYGQEHLLRLQLIRRLSEQRVPLAEIGRRLAGLGREDLQALAAEEEQRVTKLAEAPSPREYVSELLRRAQAAPGSRAAPPPPTATPVPYLEAQPYAMAPPPAPEPDPPPETWRRTELAPGVELHLRSDAEARYRHLIERLLKLAGALFRRGGH